MKLKLILLVAALTLVSAACLRTEIDIEVGDDGSLDFGGVIAVDPEAFSQIGGLLGEFDDGGDDIPGRDEICDDFVAEQGLDDFPAGPGVEATIEPYDQDGFCGARFQVRADAASADQALAEFATGGDIVLREEPDGGWYFELPLGDVADADDLADFPGFDGFFAEASYVVRVKLPGTQVDHNADEIASDGTMIWDIDLLNPPQTALFLRTEPGDPITGDADPEGGGAAGDDGGSGTVLIIVLVVAVLIAVAAAVWWFSRRKSPETPGSAQPVGSDPTQPFGFPATTTAAPPAAPEPDQPAVVASPTPEQATGRSVWDPARGSYVQWDPTAGRWLVFDDATQQWRTDT